MCVFCDDPESAGTIVHRSEHGTVFVHPDLAVRGHLMIAAARHVQNPADLSAGEWQAFTALWQRTERLLIAETGAERVIAMKLGLATPHLHVHLYPFPETATREEVFAAIDAKTRVAEEPAFAASLRAAFDAGD